MSEESRELDQAFRKHATEATTDEFDNRRYAEQAEAQRNREANAAAERAAAEQAADDSGPAESDEAQEQRHLEEYARSIQAKNAATGSSRPTTPRPGGCLVSPPMLVIGLFLVAAVVGLVLWQVGGSGDGTSEVDTAGQQDGGALSGPDGDAASADTGDEPGTADDVSAANEGCEGAATDGVDPRFDANCVNVMLDQLGVLWASFPLGWGEVPPCCIKSAFLRALLSWNPTVEVGWETHDDVETILGAPAEAYILDNGNVIFSTGLSPTAPYQLDIDVDFASWLEEADPVVSGSHSTSIGSESISPGDPFADFGGQPVFDLVTSSPMAAG